MRMLIILTFLAMFSCKTSQSGQAATSQEMDPMSQLNNQWVLVAVKGAEIENNTYNSTPQLNFKTEEKRLNGSDGCNSFFGQLDELDEQKMTIGLMGSTKAMCPEIKNSDMLGQYLNAVRSYKVNRQFLYLYDETGNEVLKYKLSE